MDTFNARRKSVVTNSRDGKIENCSGSFVFIATRMIVRASEMLIKMRKSSNHGGSGMIIIMTIKMMPTSTDKSVHFIRSLPP